MPTVGLSRLIIFLVRGVWRVVSSVVGGTDDKLNGTLVNPRILCVVSELELIWSSTTASFLVGITRLLLPKEVPSNNFLARGKVLEPVFRDSSGFCVVVVVVDGLGRLGLDGLLNLFSCFSDVKSTAVSDDKSAISEGL